MAKAGQKEPTQEQLKWDKDEKHYTKVSAALVLAWTALFIGVLAWIVVTQFMPLTEMSPSVERFKGYSAVYGNAVLTFVVMGILVLPIQRYLSNVGWVLGSRPADDFKPYVTKSIDLTIEQTGENNWLYKVGDFTFEVERFFWRQGILRKKVRGYHVIDKSGRVGHQATLSPSLFEGKTESEDADYIRDFVSSELDHHTDYFKELNYSI